MKALPYRPKSRARPVPTMSRRQALDHLVAAGAMQPGETFRPRAVLPRITEIENTWTTPAAVRIVKAAYERLRQDPTPQPGTEPA